MVYCVNHCKIYENKTNEVLQLQQNSKYFIIRKITKCDNFKIW